jgi:hypothetical protein
MTTAHAALNGSGVFQRSPNVVCRKVGPDAVLVPTRPTADQLDFIYTLSPVAYRVWQLLDDNRAEAIVDTICDEFEVDRATAAADVAELLADLTDAALISQVNGS